MRGAGPDVALEPDFVRQDAANVVRIQQGLRSSGYDGAQLGALELRIRHWHAVYGRAMGLDGERVRGHDAAKAGVRRERSQRVQFFANLTSAEYEPAEFAAKAEAAGFDGVTCSDHYWLRSVFPHLWVSLAAMACATERVTLAPSFANNLFRSPVEFAQASLAMQRLSARAATRPASEPAGPRRSCWPPARCSPKGASGRGCTGRRC